MPQDKKGKGEGEMTVREAGRLGGEKRREELGPEGYAEIGRKGGETVARERGSEFFSEIGSPGGAAKMGLIEHDHDIIKALPPQNHE